MSRKQRGFTLIELMIVIAIIAIIAAIAIPNLLAARLAANETAAIATLRNIVSSQAQFQQGAKLDEDTDGAGEYGGFVEMAGGTSGRFPNALVPPVLSTAFQVQNAGGQVTRSGYFFQMFLPDINGVGQAEPQGGFGLGVTGPDNAETTWCAYAWPANYQQSGNRTFFTNQAGDVLTTEDPAYEGAIVFNAGAAFDALSPAGDITGPVAVQGSGLNAQDTNTWRQVN